MSFPKLIYGLLNFLQLLYLIRFQLLMLLLITFARFLIFNFGAGKDFLMGLFDLPRFWNLFWFAFFSFMLSLTVMALIVVTITHGEERFQIEYGAKLEFIKSKCFQKILFVVGFICPLPLFTGVFWLGDSRLYWQIGGAVAGLGAVILVLFAAKFFAGRRDKKGWRASLTARVGNLLKRIPPEYGKGYLERKDDTVSFYPEHVYSFAVTFVFLCFYVTGFILWNLVYTPSAYQVNRFTFGVTSISYVMILLTLLCSLFSGFAFLFDRYRIPTLIVVAVILFFAQLNHTFDVRPLENNQALAPAEMLEKKRDHPYIILVAANGGGIQAAAWTTKVLKELVNECKKLDARENGCENSITLISSVSGGSVGTMFFVNSYDDTGHLSEDRLNKTVALAEESSLDHVAGGLVYADFVRNIRIFDYISSQDRGGALERSWLDNVKKTFPGDAQVIDGLNGYLSSWREDARTGKRPAVIFNSTVVETGDRFLFSTSDIWRPEKENSVESLPCDNKHKTLFRGWDRFYNFSAEKDLKRDIKITAAARLSASFPFVSPAASMKALPENTPREKSNWEKTLEGRHFVDGGYHENYGIASLLDWLDEGLCLNQTALPKILIVQIVGDHVFYEKKAESVGSGWFEQTMAPAQTMLGVRGTVQLARNESELKLFLRYWKGKNISIEKTVFEYVPEKDNEMAPLSWHLTPDQKDNINSVWKRACNPGDKNNEALKAFRQFIAPGIESISVCQ